MLDAHSYWSPCFSPLFLDWVWIQSCWQRSSTCPQVAAGPAIHTILSQVSWRGFLQPTTTRVALGPLWWQRWLLPFVVFIACDSFCIWVSISDWDWLTSFLIHSDKNSKSTHLTNGRQPILYILQLPRYATEIINSVFKRTNQTITALPFLFLPKASTL